MDFIPLQQCDFSKWNSFVESQAGGEFAHLAEWSSFYEETYNYRPHYTYIQNEGEIIGILPVIHQKGFFKNILITGSTGMLFNERNISDDQIITFLKKLSSNIGANDVIWINSHSKNNSVFISNEHVRIILKLPSDKDELWKSIGAKQRNTIRKAEKNKLIHRIITPEGSDVDLFYRLYTENYRDLGTPVNSKTYFKNQLIYFPGYIKLLLVEYNGRMIGGMWLNQYQNQMSDPEAASLRKYFFTGINDYMYFKAFEYAVDQGCKSFNMGRSQRKSGTYRFKKKWGEVIIEDYPVIRFNKSNSLNKSREKFNFVIQLWKKFPVSFANVLGPQIRKHMYFE